MFNNKKITVDLHGFKTPVVAIFAFFFFGLILSFFNKDISGKTFFMLISFIASYYSFHNLKSQYWKQISKGILIGLASLMFLVLIIQTVKAIISDSQWDFLCFYMQGLLGVNKLDFYDPNSFNIILSQGHFHHAYDSGFKAEILDVGLLSPPITMLFFAPLASLDYYTAKLIFSLLILIFIIGNSFMANIIFLKSEKSFYSFLFIFIITMLVPGTNETIVFIQTNFFLLFFLLLVIHKLSKPISGSYLAFSLIIKPISGILFLYYIFNKKWKTAFYFIITTAFLFLITGFIWGFHNITGFIKSPPTKRLPQYLYTQTINQSLIGVLNRNLNQYSQVSQKIINSLYYLGSGVLIVLSYFMTKRLNKIDTLLSFFTLVLCMLMIYPSSLDHYMIYLIPILIYFLSSKKYAKYLWLMLLPALSFLRTDVFFSYFLLWLALLTISIFISNNTSQKFQVLNI